jgi:hypothetical protein
MAQNKYFRITTADDETGKRVLIANLTVSNVFKRYGGELTELEKYSIRQAKTGDIIEIEDVKLVCKHKEPRKNGWGL